MRISSIGFAAAVAALSATATADSPHFNSATASLGSDGSLTVSFKESGLGSNVSVDYVASADAVASYGCVNNGGKNPQASNKRAVTGPVTAPATFSSGKNGSITQSLTLKPPPAPADFSCPGGQKSVIADVAYTNVSIKDATTPVTQAVAGSFTKTFYTFK
jgi:hypothetical protein